MKTDTQSLSPADQVRALVHFSQQHVFLTGRAGTGKTTLLRAICDETAKNYAIVAPTGVAAIQAGGATIHSFLRMHPHTFVPDPAYQSRPNHQVENPYSLSRSMKLSKDRIKILRSLELLIIDEISMVRADLLDAMDTVLRKFRESSLPFGGVQLLMVGDLLQLPPVVKDDEARVLSPYYPSFFFFESWAIRKAGYLSIELQTVYRQNDPEFLSLLNGIRAGRIQPSWLEKLDKMVLPREDWPDEGYIVLTTHVHQADRINAEKLQKLQSKPFVLKASIEGEFPAGAYPNDVELVLKEGAQVMFIRNNWEAGYFNGKIGWVDAWDEENQMLSITSENGEHFTVFREEWQNNRYVYDNNSQKLKQETAGSFFQFPVRLAWAITIHKSQGLTFSRAVVDAGAAFASGQVYVALSRCRSLDGLILGSPLNESQLFPNLQVQAFMELFPEPSTILEKLHSGQEQYLQNLASKALSFNWIREFHFSVAPLLPSFLVSLSNDTQEQLKSLSSTSAALQKVSDTYWPVLKQSISQGLSQESVERLQGACHYFLEQLYEKVVKPVFQLAATAEALGMKAKLRQDTEQLRKAIPFHLKSLVYLPCLFRAALNDDPSGIKPAFEFQWQQHLRELEHLYSSVSPEKAPNSSPLPPLRKGKRLSNKPKKGATVLITSDLFREGKSIDDIAKLRQLTVGTIQHHLVKAVEKEILSLEQVVNEGRVQEIIEFTEEFPPEAKMGEIIQAAGSRFAPYEIRLALWSRGKSNAEAIIQEVSGAEEV